MKTVQNFLVAIAVMTGMAVQANDNKVISGNEEGVTITKENKQVQISVLNTEEATYNISVYSPVGDLLYEGVLGNDTSLGKVFNFSDAEYGTYRIELSNENGGVSTYNVKAGQRA